ncbi:type II toxin-antitoxin system HicA family toxin [Marinactinospora rubrisoli]|uniref:Type II toxin-antitoxin system HicA family toxin n=1 Tax=Marinactinospora rubrisoli TaxID=2715399 RepID=A0ABW2KP13_9ACTN
MASQKSGNDVIKEITGEYRGYTDSQGRKVQVVGQKGSHVKIGLCADGGRKHIGPSVIVPVHGNNSIPAGTLKSIERQARALSSFVIKHKAADLAKQAAAQRGTRAGLKGAVQRAANGKKSRDASSAPDRGGSGRKGRRAR